MMESGPKQGGRRFVYPSAVWCLAAEVDKGGLSIKWESPCAKVGSHCIHFSQFFLQVCWDCQRFAFDIVPNSNVLCRSGKHWDQAELAPYVPATIDGHIVAGSSGSWVNKRLKGESFVALWSCVLYAYIGKITNASHSVRCSTTYYHKLETIVRLKCSTCLFLVGSIQQLLSPLREVVCIGLWRTWIWNVVRCPLGLLWVCQSCWLRAPKNIMTTIVSVIFVVGIDLLNPVERFFIIKVYWFPLLVFKRGPEMSMVMSSSGFVAENNRSFCCFLFSRCSRMNRSLWRLRKPR